MRVLPCDFNQKSHVRQTGQSNDIDEKDDNGEKHLSLLCGGDQVVRPRRPTHGHPQSRQSALSYSVRAEVNSATSGKLYTLKKMAHKFKCPISGCEVEGLPYDIYLHAGGHFPINDKSNNGTSASRESSDVFGKIAHPSKRPASEPGRKERDPKRPRASLASSSADVTPEPRSTSSSQSVLPASRAASISSHTSNSTPANRVRSAHGTTSAAVGGQLTPITPSTTPAGDRSSRVIAKNMSVKDLRSILFAADHVSRLVAVMKEVSDQEGICVWHSVVDSDSPGVFPHGTLHNCSATSMGYKSDYRSKFCQDLNKTPDGSSLRCFSCGSPLSANHGKGCHDESARDWIKGLSYIIYNVDTLRRFLFPILELEEDVFADVEEYAKWLIEVSNEGGNTDRNMSNMLELLYVYFSCRDIIRVSLLVVNTYLY
ncbi:hypothetical protein B0H21DRAFT_713954 [Amylocystis lapponica]|nr:hypothetical protein B0H21DRAFT_713954 [Amylocystis lapponica]